jgi:hypothetical protein
MDEINDCVDLVNGIREIGFTAVDTTMWWKSAKPTSKLQFPMPTSLRYVGPKWLIFLAPLYTVDHERWPFSWSDFLRNQFTKALSAPH